MVELSIVHTRTFLVTHFMCWPGQRDLLVWTSEHFFCALHEKLIVALIGTNAGNVNAGNVSFDLRIRLLQQINQLFKGRVTLVFVLLFWVGNVPQAFSWSQCFLQCCDRFIRPNDWHFGVKAWVNQYRIRFYETKMKVGVPQHKITVFFQTKGDTSMHYR